MTQSLFFEIFSEKDPHLNVVAVLVLFLFIFFFSSNLYLTSKCYNSLQKISANTIRLTLLLRQILTHVLALALSLINDQDKTQTSVKNWRECRRKTNCVKRNSLSSEHRFYICYMGN